MGDGTYVTKRSGRGANVVKTIVTPAGTFRMIDKAVFDRAMRSANTALQQGSLGTDPTRDHARKR